MFHVKHPLRTLYLLILICLMAYSSKAQNTTELGLRAGVSKNIRVTSNKIEFQQTYSPNYTFDKEFFIRRNLGRVSIECRMTETGYTLSHTEHWDYFSNTDNRASIFQAISKIRDVQSATSIQYRFLNSRCLKSYIGGFVGTGAEIITTTLIPLETSTTSTVTKGTRYNIYALVGLDVYTSLCISKKINVSSLLQFNYRTDSKAFDLSSNARLSWRPGISCSF